MKVTILGTGMVGKTISSKFIKLGHNIIVGSSTANNGKAIVWFEKSILDLGNICTTRGT